MYQVIVYICQTDLCTVRLKSITQVAKFLETVNFSICEVDILTPKNNWIKAVDVLEVWRS